MRVDASATIKDLARVQGDVLAAVRQVLGQLAALAYQQAKATTSFKDRSGKLRGSFQRGQKGPWAQFVAVGGRSAPYALFIEAGSKPHEIRPRKAKFLRFEQGGQVRFAKRVYHPGTKPARFMQAARDNAAGLAGQYFEAGVSAAIR